MSDYTPVQASYPYGTSITLTATPSDGYFFQSWSGDVTSANATYTFALVRNTTVEALFLPVGTVQDPNLVGYAAIQDDQGTPYIVTGGSLGATVTATTLDELKSYLASPEPYVVAFSGLVAGADAISVASHKTLLGVGDSAHLQGIGLTINGARNVIVRNVAISHVLAAGATDANDAIEITGRAKNVWIDHCELFSDLLNGKDYYDGLLDIKNEASFITVSSTVFRDHYKVSLVSSGDEQSPRVRSAASTPTRRRRPGTSAQPPSRPSVTSPCRWRRRASWLPASSRSCSRWRRRRVPCWSASPTSRPSPWSCTGSSTTTPRRRAPCSR